MTTKKNVKKGEKKTTPRKRNPKKKSKTIMDRLKTASKVWDTLKTATKITLAVATLGMGVYVYRQFHKTPEEVEKETTEMRERFEEKRKDQDPARRWSGRMGAKFGSWVRGKAVEK